MRTAKKRTVDPDIQDIDRTQEFFYSVIRAGIDDTIGTLLGLKRVNRVPEVSEVAYQVIYVYATPAGRGVAVEPVKVSDIQSCIP